MDYFIYFKIKEGYLTEKHSLNQMKFKSLPIKKNFYFLNMNYYLYLKIE